MGIGLLIRVSQPLTAVRASPGPSTAETLRLVRDTLDQAGYASLVTGHHEELPQLLDTENRPWFLLDLMLPGTDGIELMARVPIQTTNHQPRCW